MLSRRVLHRARQIVRNQFSRRAWRGWRHMVVNHGWGAVPKALAYRVQQKLAPRAPAAQETDPRIERHPGEAHPFDRAHGVDTGGLIWGEDLRSGSRNDAWNTAYYGVAPSLFHTAMSHLPEELREGSTFIDVGSGKGRAVMLASAYPFARIVGVEISPELHRIAVENLQRFSSGRDQRVELLEGDAASFAFPAGPLVVYFFQPFCRPVLERVLTNLKQSFKDQPRQIAVVYINPEVRELLDESGFLERVWDARVRLTEEDLSADEIGSIGEDCTVYRARF